MLYKAITNVFAGFRWNMNIMKREMETVKKKDKTIETILLGHREKESNKNNNTEPSRPMGQ